MMIDNKQYLMILERSGENLTVDKINDEYVLEGVFAQFGIENNNHRIYEEKEYLPHLDYLKKKIEENRLLGELDHPDKFDISLAKVSHLIEEVKYDPKKRQVIGRIKLLDTPSGQIAKNLVDTGVPISISSRAAGVVGENKKVQIKRIFTYDLVADPGFENAQMNRINESLGFDNDDTLAIYDVTEKFPAFFESLESSEIYTLSEKEKTPTTMPQNNFVSIEEMNKYSLIIKEEIEKINERLNTIGISSLATKDEKIAKLEEEVNNLRLFGNYLSETQNNAIAFANYLSETQSEKINQTINYADYVAAKADHGIQYAELIAEKMDQGFKHNNYLAETINQSINYTESIGEVVDKAIKFNNYLVGKMNETIAYAEHIAEHTDNGICYAEYLTENVASKDDFKNLTEYAEYMFENMNVKKDTKTADVSEDKTSITDPVAASVKESVTTRYTQLDKKIEAVLESIKKQKTEDKANDARYPFTKFLGENKINEFLLLGETEKQRVANALTTKPSFNEEEIVKVWEQALTNVEVNEKWLTDMPAEYFPLWEGASKEVKNHIIRQSRVYNLDTPYRITNFWQTRGLGKTETSIVNELTESKRVETAKTEVNPLGYSPEHVANVAAGLSRFK